MEITVNDARREVADGVSLLSLLDLLHLPPAATVVELNGQVLDRIRYPEVVLAPNDALELVRFVGGG